MKSRQRFTALAALSCQGACDDFWHRRFSPSQGQILQIGSFRAAIYLKFTVLCPVSEGARRHGADWRLGGIAPVGNRASLVMSYLVLAIFPLAMIFGAIWDLTTMTIPNMLTAALAVAFLLFVPFAGLGWQDVALHLAAGALMLVIGMTMFGLGWIGGGDAKFVAAIALWLGWSELLGYLLVASLLGGALTLLLLWFRTMPLPPAIFRNEWIARLHDRKAGIPYGVALGLGGLWMFQHSVWLEAATRAA
jgi:prepilin peptidase CpaA